MKWEVVELSEVDPQQSSIQVFRGRFQEFPIPIGLGVDEFLAVTTEEGSGFGSLEGPLVGFDESFFIAHPFFRQLFCRKGVGGSVAQAIRSDVAGLPSAGGQLADVSESSFRHGVIS